MSLINRIRNFRTNRDGVSAVEFALIAPVMVMMYFACVEVSFLMLVDRKVTNSASALGDLVARTTSIDDDEMDNIFASAIAIFAPYSTTSAQMRVTSIEDDKGTAKVVWSSSKNMSAYSKGATVTVPSGILPAGGTVIYAEVSFDYDSTLGYFLPGTKTLEDEFYLRPRRSNSVDRKTSP